MIPILSTQEIKALEAAADAQGISYLRLMENAGSACAKTIRTRFDKTDKRKVVVLCGKGKNGGDGFVAARKLQENGYDVRVLLTCGSPTAENAQEMFERLTELEIPVDPYDAASDRQHARLQEADILIDAVFGTGFSGVLPESLQELFSFLRTCKGYVVSIDLPSGLSADTNEVESGAVYADLTISVMALKKALVCAPAKDHAGEVEVVSIGVPKELYAPYDKLVTFTEKEMADWFPARDSDANKGSFGKALIVAGSYEMPGAALLASSACVETGAGLVRLAFPECAYAAVTAAVPEKVLLPLKANRFGRISAQNEKRLLDTLSSSTACLIGCGLGVDYDTQAFIFDLDTRNITPITRDMSETERNAAFDELEAFYESVGMETIDPLQDSRMGIRYGMDSGETETAKNWLFSWRGWYYVYPIHYDMYDSGKGNDWLTQTEGWMKANANPTGTMEEQDGTYVYCTPE